ncbi:hypothetical protein [Nitrospira sp. Kam-Ns4a]
MGLLMISKAVVLLVMSAAVLQAGCGVRVIKPEESPAPYPFGAPLPLVAGLRHHSQNKFWTSDMGAALVTRLTQAKLFRSVHYSTVPDSWLNLEIDAAFEGSFAEGSGNDFKAFLTGFLLLLPAPFVEFEWHFKGAASVQVFEAGQGGWLVTSCQASSDVPVFVKFGGLFSGERWSKEAMKLLVDDLLAQLVAQMQKDRGLFLRLVPA